MSDENVIDRFTQKTAAAVDGLASVLESYEQRAQAIKDDASRTHHWKEQALADLVNQTVPAAEAAAAAIWGDLIHTDDQGGQGFDQEAPAWRALNAANVALRNARDIAERANFNPDWADFSRLRAQAMITRAQDSAGIGEHPALRLRALYEDADPLTKDALQQFAGALLPPGQYAGAEWTRLRQSIEKDRQRALDTPQVQRTRAKRDALLAELERAYSHTLQAVQRFGEKSYPLSKLRDGIGRSVTIDPVTGVGTVDYSWRPVRTFTMDGTRMVITGARGLFD